jgi:hypothetical protein
MDSTYSIFFPQQKNFDAKLRKMSGLNWSLLICNVIAWQRTFRGDSFGPGVGWRLFFQLRGCCGDIIGDTV